MAHRWSIVAAVAALLVFVAAGAVSTARGPRIIRVSTTATYQSFDPAVVFSSQYAQLANPTCAKLLTFPDQAGPAGARLVSDVARALPSVSSDGRTYTFTLRSDFRFNTGEPVTAAHFAYVFNRILHPALSSPAAVYLEDVVGARDVLAGRAVSPTGVRVRGNRLTVRLTRRAPDFPARLATQYFCAVPLSYPADRNAGARPPAAAGPYYIAELEAGRRIVLRRNPHYRGQRPRQIDEFVWLLSVPLDAIKLQVERGDTEVGYPGPASLAEIAKRYGINKSQFFVAPSLSTAFLALNTQRPLFRNNVWLRRAVNFAIDRRALLAASGGFTGKRTDQLLSPAFPGFRDVDIYPLKQPDLKKARALARGRTRTAKAVMYTSNPTSTALARAQVVQFNLKQIGIEVEIRITPMPEPRILRSRDAPYDIWDPGMGGVEYPDPYAALNRRFEGRFIADRNNNNFSFFDDPKFNRKLAAAARLTGAVRVREYGELDIELSRDAAPVAPYATGTHRLFVAANVGCVTLNPVYGVSFTTLCLKR